MVKKVKVFFCIHMLITCFCVLVMYSITRYIIHYTMSYVISLLIVDPQVKAMEYALRSNAVAWKLKAFLYKEL